MCFILFSGLLVLGLLMFNYFRLWPISKLGVVLLEFSFMVY